MEDYKLTVKALAANLNIPIEELAVQSGINPTHLKNVSAGRAKMTADDVLKLSEFTGVPARNIEPNFLQSVSTESGKEGT